MINNYINNFQSIISTFLFYGFKYTLLLLVVILILSLIFLMIGCIIILLLYAGLRESELVNLRIVDIKLEERFLNIIGKGNKFRQVMINNLMYNALKDYLDERQNMNIKNPYLIIGQKNKQTQKPLNRNFCNRLLNKYKEICKINYLHPHLLRSYFCSNALHNAGYTIEQVANQAGHSSLNTTKGYLVSGQKDLLKLSNLL